MDYKVEVDFAPMYECVSSMTVFLSKQNHTAMDSGKLWVRDVQARFAPLLLRKMQEVVKKLDDFSLAPYIWSCPGERSVEGFLVWFDALTSGELYEISGRFGQSVPSILRSLGILLLISCANGTRDTSVESILISLKDLSRKPNQDARC